MRTISHRLAVGHRLLQDTSGASAVMWALALPVVIGGIGLGVDITEWHTSKRNLQTITDAAVVASSYEISGSNESEANMLTVANGEFTRNGFSEDDGVELTLNYPPSSGSYSGNNYAVEIIATQPQERYFSKLFMSSDPVSTSRAVALRQPAGSACVLALETLQSDALLFQGNTTINLNGCVAAANSTNEDAIGISGSSTLNAESIYTAGSYYT